MSLEDTLPLDNTSVCRPIRDKNGRVIAYGCVVPKEDMGKFEIILETKEDQHRFDRPAKFSEALRKNFREVSLDERVKVTGFVSSRLRVLKRKQESASARFGVIGSAASSENEV